MAEGRMLKRVISTSPRLAALKNDTHRLLYTWLIPFLDIEGRIEADPRIIKGHVAPLLDHITMRVINSALSDMAANGLIVLYQIKGNKYLQLERFDKHQNLRKDRERGSDIPAPTPGGLPEDSRRTPGQGPEDAGTTPAQEKLREEKLSKGNYAREEQPVDNSEPAEKEKPQPAPSKTSDEKHENHGLQKIGLPANGNGSPKGFLSDLQNIMPQIFSAYPDFSVHRQVQFFLESHAQIAQMAKGETNPGAVLHSLRSFLRAADKGVPPPPGKVRAWLESAFRAENGKYNARDAERSAAQWKGPMKPDEATLYNELIAQAGEMKGVG